MGAIVLIGSHCDLLDDSSTSPGLQRSTPRCKAVSSIASLRRANSSSSHFECASNRAPQKVGCLLVKTPRGTGFTQHLPHPPTI